MKLACLILAMLIPVVSAHAEPLASPDFSGIWKRRCDLSYGLRIEHSGGNLFSLRFCASGSCGNNVFIAGTPIQGDPRFNVVSETEIGLRRVDVQNAFLVYHRCSRDPAWRDGDAITGLSISTATGTAS